MLSTKLSGYCVAAVVVLNTTIGICASGADEARELASQFEQEVTRRLNVPAEEQEHYAQLLKSALDEARVSNVPPEFFLLVDRSPHVQAAMIEWKAPDGMFHLIGATPVSTGRPGTYEHFVTPLGVYEHRVANLDFRSKGTPNQFGIRGYGAEGMRIFDFGWVKAPKGWGDYGISRLRLQVHATDPDRLDRRLGTPQSEGCVRTTASFNVFLDSHGILDGDYDKVAAQGHTLSVLSPTREQTPWSGRYLVVVDSGRQQKPVWARASPPEPETTRSDIRRGTRRR